MTERRGGARIRTRVIVERVCATCSKAFDAFSAAGHGPHDSTNWQAAHLACNISKGRKVAIGADPALMQMVTP